MSCVGVGGSLEHAGIISWRNDRGYFFRMHDGRALQLGLVGKAIRHRDNGENLTQLQASVKIAEFSQERLLPR